MNYLESEIFKIVSEEAQSLDLNAYVIGGYVRDSLLKRESKDIDIVIEGDGIAVAQKVAKRLKRKLSIFKNYGTAMLNWREWEIEFVGARKESYSWDSRNPITEPGTLEEDQERRDFTINALAFSLQPDSWGDLIDPFNGIDDLKRGIIRTPLEPIKTYSDDPLRMLRAIRFATQLSFTIEKRSLEAIKENRERIKILSKERVAEELNKILLSPKPSIGLYLMDETGLLEMILPQIVKLKGVETINGKGHKDNFIHTLEVLDNLALSSDNLWLRWAALLHDIAKPTTKRFDSKVGWSFHGHEFIGAKMIPKIFKRLKLPLNEKMKFVQKMVLLHRRPISLVEEEVTDSAVRRLLFDAGDDIDQLMLLCEADITSKNRERVAKHKNNFAMVREKLIEVEEKDAVRNFKNPITGDIVMERYGVGPGREIGVIKEYIKNAILDGEIGNNLEEALQLMEKKAKEIGLVSGDINGERHQ